MCSHQKVHILMDSKWRAEITDPSKPKPPGAIRLLCLSDTHGEHDKIPKECLYDCDILLHAGDFSAFGKPEDVTSFKSWLDHINCQKVVIAGNCDLTFDTAHLDRLSKQIDRFFHPTQPLDSVKPAFLKDCGNTKYAEHELVEISGIKIFASPYTPEFYNLAFQIAQGEGESRWSAIPDNVDVLLTHGPPRGVCDLTSSGMNVGCPDLRKAIERTKPALCIFGHIHEARGVGHIGDTLCCNVAIGEGRASSPEIKPILIDLIPK